MLEGQREMKSWGLTLQLSEVMCLCICGGYCATVIRLPGYHCFGKQCSQDITDHSVSA